MYILVNTVNSIVINFLLKNKMAQHTVIIEQPTQSTVFHAPDIQQQDNGIIYF